MRRYLNTSCSPIVVSAVVARRRPPRTVACSPAPLLSTSSPLVVLGSTVAPLSAPSLVVAARFAAAASAASTNPYKVLGVPPSASREEIKKAYRIMAKKFHPDAPGGSHDKFQLIQEAYDQVKTGVWVRKDGETSGGSGGSSNRYQGFRYETADTKGQKISYEQFYAEMHMGKKNTADPDIPPDPKARNPAGAMADARVQAWFRLIMSWTVMFVFLRLVLLVAFPPKHHAAKQKPQPRKQNPTLVSPRLAT